MQSFYTTHQVVLFTIIELYNNEEDQSINHHGFSRDVSESKIEESKLKLTFKIKIFNIAKTIGRCFKIFTGV